MLVEGFGAGFGAGFAVLAAGFAVLLAARALLVFGRIDVVGFALVLEVREEPVGDGLLERVPLREALVGVLASGIPTTRGSVAVGAAVGSGAAA